VVLFTMMPCVARAVSSWSIMLERIWWREPVMAIGVGVQAGPAGP
jgi:hypothetical protein